MKIGTKIIFSEELKAEVKDIKEDGNRIIEFFYEGIFNEILDRLGNVPLPPYIKEELDEPEEYQTVYSKILDLLRHQQLVCTLLKNF